VEQAPLPTPSSTRAKTLGRVGVGVTLGLTAASLGGFWYGRHFLNERLSPMVEAELQKALKRPVKLGKVERVSLNGVQFGRSEIPATDKEQNFLTVDAVDVQVDALRYLQTSKVGVDVTIKKPQAFLKQNATTGQYFSIPESTGAQPGESSPIDLKTIKIEDGRLTLQPDKTRQLVTLDRLQLQSDWRIADPNNQSVRASGGAKVVIPRLAVGNAPPTSDQLAQAIERQREDGGNVQVDADWSLSSGTNIQVRSQNLLASSLQGLLRNLPFTPVQGRIDSNLNISIRQAKSPDEAIRLQGTVKVKDISLKIPSLPYLVTKVVGNIQFDGGTTTLQNVSGNYGSLALRTGGTVSKTAGFNLDATLEPTDIAKALQTFAVKTPVAIAGEVKVNAKIVGKQPVLTAAFTSTKPVTVDRLTLNQVQGRIKTKDFTTLEFSRIKATTAVDATIQGEGQLRLPTAKKAGSTLFAFNVAGVDAEKVAKLYDAKLPAAIGSVNAAVQVYGSLDNVQVLTQFDAPNATYPAIGELLIANNKLTVRNTTVQFPAGAAAVNGSIDLTGNRAWQAQLTSDNIPLSALATNQRGRVSGTVALVSSSGSFDLDKIVAEADLNFANAVAAIPDAIKTQLTWDGKSLYVPNLQVGDYLTAKGRVDLAVNAQKVPTAVSGIDLDLTSRNLSLSQLSAFAPNLSASTAGTLNFSGKLAGELDRLNVSGKLDLQGVRVNQLAAGFIKGNGANLPTGTANFSGNVRGAVTSPRVEGNLQLANLKFNRVAFESRLAGPLSFDLKQGLNLDLQGNSDRIAARLDSRFQPLAFDVKLEEATATGKRSSRSNSLDVVIENLPMALLGSLAGQSNVDGKLSSQLVVSLGKNPSVVGDVAIARLRYGRAQAEQLVAKVNYANGYANITNGKAILSGDGQGQGEYTFNLAVAPQAETQVKGQVKAVNGNIQDIFTALQWFDFNSLAQGLAAPKYAKAADVQPLKPIGVESSPLYKQLEYFSQLNARIDQQETIAANSNNNLPPLAEFKGQIDGTIDFASSKSSGLGVSFDINGKQWEYGKLAVDDVRGKGQFRNNELKLDKLRFSSGDSFGQIVDAKIGLLGQSGKVELSNFPIESLRSLPIFTNIPVDVTGNANGTATIGGNLFNPKAVGQITLADATINRQSLESVGGTFDYNGGRFKFTSLVRVGGKEPLNISGDIPYRLPFALVSGGSDLKLDIDVKDEGLAFINILNQPVRWQDGKGKAMLAITGTTRRPQVKGQIVLEGASMQVAGLPGNVTDLKGNINFDLDRLQSDLTGNFSDGKLTAKGILAIADPGLFTEDKPEFNNPLTLYAERLKLDLKDLYAGGANGFILVRGAALAPVLSGEIALSNGRIALGNSDNLPITSIANSNTNEPKKENSESAANVGFNQLIVKLRDNIQITRAPLLNFLVEGDVRVNGTLADIRPSGKINILRGQVNAISARFRLDRAFENYAEFVPDQGLNPKLNVRLLGSIPEVTRAPISAANTPLDAFANPGSTPVSIFGAQRTLQVQATLTGFALNIRPEDIDLRSSPPRTKAELLALIGGGLLQQVGGDPAAALANLAGGTVISFLQDAIGDALNLSEFNLSPTTTTPVGGRGTTLGLAAEAAIDISRSFSVSVRSVLNDPSQLTNYTLRYRLNPNTLIRTNTDLKGNNGASVEFETRF
jgi:translocation and assembly module TamB